MAQQNLQHNMQDAYERAMQEALRELELIGLEIVAKVVQYLERRNIQVTGDLTKSIQQEVTRELNSATLRVGAYVRYAHFVHFGTKPHWPPRKPIVRWVKKKFGLTGKELQKRVYFTRRKIGLRGTKGRPFLAAPFRLFRNVIAKRVADAMSRGLA